MWARLYKCCTKCETSKRKHYGGGLCYACYSNKRYAENPKPKQASERRRYKLRRDLIRKRTKEYYYKNLKKVKKRMAGYRDKKFFNGLRVIVLTRDNNTCQSCFGLGNIIHHIDGNGRGSTNPNNTESNLITLCRACHLDIHNAERISRKYEIAL